MGNELILKDMNSDQFRYFSKFSFENFLSNAARSSGQSVEALRVKMGKPPCS